jgi:hypothetical protein
MLKKLSLAFLAALLFTLLFAVTAYAAPDNFQAVLAKANNAIDHEIDKAVAEADRVYDQYKADVAKVNWLLEHDCISPCTAKKRLAALSVEFGRDVDRIAARLIEKTERIVDDVIRQAKRRGIDIEKVYIKVVLAGRAYLVDPLRIVGN